MKRVAKDHKKRPGNMFPGKKLIMKLYQENA